MYEKMTRACSSEMKSKSKMHVSETIKRKTCNYVTFHITSQLCLHLHPSSDTATGI